MRWGKILLVFSIQGWFFFCFWDCPWELVPWKDPILWCRILWRCASDDIVIMKEEPIFVFGSSQEQQHGKMRIFVARLCRREIDSGARIAPFIDSILWNVNFFYLAFFIFIFISIFIFFFWVLQTKWLCRMMIYLGHLLLILAWVEERDQDGDPCASVFDPWRFCFLFCTEFRLNFTRGNRSLFEYATVDSCICSCHRSSAPFLQDPCRDFRPFLALFRILCRCLVIWKRMVDNRTAIPAGFQGSFQWSCRILDPKWLKKLMNVGWMIPVTNDPSLTCRVLIVD